MSWFVLQEDYHRRSQPLTAGITELSDEHGWLQQLRTVTRVLVPVQMWVIKTVQPMIAVLRWVVERLVLHRIGTMFSYSIDACALRVFLFGGL